MKPNGEGERPGPFASARSAPRCRPAPHPARGAAPRGRGLRGGDWTRDLAGGAPAWADPPVPASPKPKCLSRRLSSHKAPEPSGTKCADRLPKGLIACTPHGCTQQALPGNQKEGHSQKTALTALNIKTRQSARKMHHLELLDVGGVSPVQAV